MELDSSEGVRTCWSGLFKTALPTNRDKETLPGDPREHSIAGIDGSHIIHSRRQSQMYFTTLYADNQSYLKTARNVIVGFYGFGLLIAPEVYSPFMRKDLR